MVCIFLIIYIPHLIFKCVKHRSTFLAWQLSGWEGIVSCEWHVGVQLHLYEGWARVHHSHEGSLVHERKWLLLAGGEFCMQTQDGCRSNKGSFMHKVKLPCAHVLAHRLCGSVLNRLWPGWGPLV